MIKVIMHGYKGQMGKVIIDLINKDDDCEIVAGIDKNAKLEDIGFPVFQDIKLCDVPADIIIDFSIAKAVDGVIDYAVKNKVGLVICTTGLSADTEENIKKASLNIPIFKSANMSLGINIVSNILKKISPILYSENFDIEVIERHHNKKVDAPSGTAFLLADKINESLDNKMDYVYDRHDLNEKRNKDEIGLHALRGGTIVGEHEVIFAGIDEVIEISHKAYSKEVFAVGAIKAGKFLNDKENGIYSMANLVDYYLN